MLNARQSAGSRLCTAVLSSLLSTFAVVAQGEGEAENLTPQNEKGTGLVDALTGGEVKVSGRYRVEFVDQKGIGDNGWASTLRTTLGYRTDKFEGFQAFGEFEDVTDLGGQNLHANLGFGSYGNGIGTRPVVADPAGTNVQQIYLDYSRDESLARVGAQEVILDDARFVGNVGWRQHHQSYDAVLLTTQEVENAAFYFAYVNKVRQVTRRVLETNTFLLNGHYELEDIGQITAYNYYIDLTQMAFFGLSTNTFGIEFKGQREIDDDWGYRYEAEYAHQTDVADNPAKISADYYHVMLGGTCNDFGLRVGYEVLGGSVADGAFQTPLATGHAFNGWADKFLATPATGLRDFYIKAEGPVGPLQCAVVFHDFRADSGGANYGNEIDAVVNYKSSWGQSFGAKAAYYNADRFTTDTTKAWVFTGFAF